MINLDALSADEKQKYQKYLIQARNAGKPPGMADSRDSNTGSALNPSDLLLKDAPVGTYTGKMDAIYGLEQK